MLKQWLARQKLDKRPIGPIAGAIGITPTSLWRIANGKQTPSARVALAIERVTGIPAVTFATEALRRESEAA